MREGSHSTKAARETRVDHHPFFLTRRLHFCDKTKPAVVIVFSRQKRRTEQDAYLWTGLSRFDTEEAPHRRIFCPATTNSRSWRDLRNGSRNCFSCALCWVRFLHPSHLSLSLLDLVLYSKADCLFPAFLLLATLAANPCLPPVSY